jgi:hypothetical protein
LPNNVYGGSKWLIKQGNTEIGIISFPEKEIKANANSDQMKIESSPPLYAEYLDGNYFININDLQRFE